MNIIKLGILVIACILGYQYWQKHSPANSSKIDIASSVSRSESSNGFVTLPPFDDINGSEVVIFSPENCPKEGARRADDLANQLASKGIPVARLQHANFSLSNADSSTANRIMSVMNGEVPIVFVKGRAKSNPSFDEVVSEYGSAGL